MKRALSCLGPDQIQGRPLSPKCHKPSPGNNCSVTLNCASRSSQALPLKPEALQAQTLQSSVPYFSTQSISSWVSHCDSCSESEMGPPPTPSTTSNDGGQRRISKLSYRRQRSQSPAKKTSTQYRSRYMADARVFVDHVPEPPSDVEDQLKHVFEVSMLDHIGQSSFSNDLSGASTIRSTIAELAEKYCNKSRQMAKDCAGEGQWKSYLLTGLVEPLEELWPNVLRLSASEKPWISELRPTPPSFEDILDAGPFRPTPVESRTSNIDPEAPPLSQRPPAQVFANTPTLSASSNVASDVTTDESNGISIPKPDIALGLAHTSFARLQGRMLWDLQDNNRVLSEPHQSGIGLHFPLLIIEAKGLAAGSNIVGAQNQAAVDGACALNILRDLKLAATTYMFRTSIDQPARRQILFSVVTEGAIHELWVHYQIGETYHMTLLRIWRTTFVKEAREFVQALSKILEWGVNDFKVSILKELTAIETELRRRRLGEPL